MYLDFLHVVKLDSNWLSNIIVSAGKYCEGSGLSAVTGDCDPGWYCTGGAYTSRPVSTSTDLHDTAPFDTCAIYLLNATGDPCQPGK